MFLRHNRAKLDASIKPINIANGVSSGVTGVAEGSIAVFCLSVGEGLMVIIDGVTVGKAVGVGVGVKFGVGMGVIVGFTVGVGVDIGVAVGSLGLGEGEGEAVLETGNGGWHLEHGW